MSALHVMSHVDGTKCVVCDWLVAGSRSSGTGRYCSVFRPRSFLLLSQRFLFCGFFFLRLILRNNWYSPFFFFETPFVNGLFSTSRRKVFRALASCLIGTRNFLTALKLSTRFFYLFLHHIFSRFPRYTLFKIILRSRATI